MRIGWAVPLVVLAMGAGTGPHVYRNEPMRVRSFEVPAGWDMAPQPSYPRLLASFSHPDGGKLTLSAQRVPAGTTALALAGDARAPLEKQGFRHLRIVTDGTRAQLEGDADNGRRLLRQLYLVDGGIGYVVTLLSPSAAKLGEDFDAASRSLQVGAVPAADAPPR